MSTKINQPCKIVFNDNGKFKCETHGQHLLYCYLGGFRCQVGEDNDSPLFPLNSIVNDYLRGKFYIHLLNTYPEKYPTQVALANHLKLPKQHVCRDILYYQQMVKFFGDGSEERMLNEKTVRAIRQIKDTSLQKKVISIVQRERLNSVETEELVRTFQNDANL